MDFDFASFIPQYVIFLLSLTMHEGGHALAALWGGDETAYHNGQVSVSPIPHIQQDPIGTILVPIVTFYSMGFCMGWASAPYDPVWAAHHPRRASWMSLAGPAANLLLSILGAALILIGLGTGFFALGPDGSFVAAIPGWRDTVEQMVWYLFALNIMLFAFNLLPIPPLDGFTVMGLLLNEENAIRLQEFERQPMAQMIGLMVAWNMADYVLTPVFAVAMSVMIVLPMALFGIGGDVFFGLADLNGILADMNAAAADLNLTMGR